MLKCIAYGMDWSQLPNALRFTDTALVRSHGLQQVMITVSEVLKQITCAHCMNRHANMFGEMLNRKAKCTARAISKCKSDSQQADD